MLLREVNVETILTNFISQNAAATEGAQSFQVNLNDILFARLVETPGELNLNWSLFSFLSWHASNAVVERVVAFEPELLEHLS